MTRRFPPLAALGLLAATLATPARAGEDDEERALASVTIPEGKSPLPKPTEWPAAPRVRPTRRSAAAAGCRVYVLREWMRLRCPGDPFAMSMLGGDLDGIAFWIDAATKEGEVLIPLRRGGKHVVQIWKAGKDANGGFVAQPTLLLQQYWLEGAPVPVIIVL